MGSTVIILNHQFQSQDHPHIHGEHLKTRADGFDTQGSPPYTWGALKIDITHYIVNGITPIYMGSTVGRD